jgi:hypothetical protein
MATIQLDRPRKIKFGFNAIGHMKSNFGITNPMEAFQGMENGDLSIIKMFIECCLIGDDEGLTSNAVGDYMDAIDFDKLADIMKEAVEESSWFQSAKKKAAKGKKTGKK